MLYLWYVAKTDEILNTVQQQLTAENSVDGNMAPSVASSQKCKAVSKEQEMHKQIGS